MKPYHSYGKKLPQIESRNLFENSPITLDKLFQRIAEKQASTQIHLNKINTHIQNMNGNIENLVKVMMKKWFQYQGEFQVPNGDKGRFREQLRLKQHEVTKIGQVSKMDSKQYEPQYELRFKNVDVQLPQKNIPEDQILIWVGKVCKKVFSIGFTLFKNEELDYNKMKIFCSENILRNLIRLSKQNQISSYRFQVIDKCLKNDLLPYFCFLYPQTEEKQTSSKFSSLLIERDTLQQNQNDMCSRAGADFHFQQDGNYNSQIMKFLNFIISLPSRLPSLEQNRGNSLETLGHLFRQDMQTIFQSIQSETTALELYNFIPNKNDQTDLVLSLMQKFKPISPKTQKQDQNDEKNKKQMNETVKQNNNSEEKKKQIQYQQKVKSYSSYQIGQKLSENLELFKEYQIKTGNLRLKNSALMRVITKWCSQIEVFFNPTQILNRQAPWKMKNGTEKYMQKSKMNILNLLLQKQKSYINQFLSEIKKNNYKNQQQFSQKDINPELKIYSESDAMVGQFCSSIFRTNQSFLILYLNKLIHGINRALKNFQTLILGNSSIFDQITSELCDTDNFQKLQSNLHQIQQNLDEESKDQNSRVYLKALSQIPQLISFKIGDLLRCKCTSKQSEIMTLYKIIQYINLKRPEFMKILKVRNKLDQGNKDILMNILYRNSMVIQMQLAIKSQKSKFIECSNKFNHYFYQMKRAQFGPIMEMCSIWASQDQRSNFYLTKLNEDNRRKKTSFQKQCCKNKQNLHTISQPFKCQLCSYFYYDCNFYQKHSYCRQCRYSTCFLCILQESDEKQKKQILSTFDQESSENLKEIKFCTELPKQCGKILNLNSKQKKIRTFKPILYNKQYYLFHYIFSYRTGQKQLQVIYKFKQAQLKESFPLFCVSNLIFQESGADNQIFYLDKEKAEKQYFIPKIFEQTEKSQKVSIALMKKKLIEDIIEQAPTKILKSIQRINFSENQLKSVKILNKKFPNTKLAILDSNKIQKIQKKDVENWNEHLRSLYLRGNKINDIKGIGELKKLIELNLSQNDIVNIDEEVFQNLSELKWLNLNKNKLEVLPKKIGNLKSLQTLYLNENNLQTLPKQFSELFTLSIFHASNNRLTEFPDGFGDLLHLRQLYLSVNQITVIPPQFGKLMNLKTFHFSFNKISQLDNQFCKLFSLTSLDISENLITQLPKQFGKLRNLRQLFIYSNQLQSLPTSFGNLEKLIELQIFQNKLIELPDSFCNLYRLQKLNMSQNKLLHLPVQFGKLKKLSDLNVCHNKLTNLPISFGDLKSLQKLLIYCNEIVSIPQQFGNLHKLDILFISSNKLTHIPPSFGNLASLKQLQIFDNLLTNLPEEFSNLSNLKILNFEKNKIKTLPMGMSRLKSLEEMEMDEIQNLSALQQMIENCSRLKKIKMNHKQYEQQSELAQINLACYIRGIEFYGL